MSAVGPEPDKEAPDGRCGTLSRGGNSHPTECCFSTKAGAARDPIVCEQPTPEEVTLR
jgi:hypothetical protein